MKTLALLLAATVLLTSCAPPKDAAEASERTRRLTILDRALSFSERHNVVSAQDAEDARELAALIANPALPPTTITASSGK